MILLAVHHYRKNYSSDEHWTFAAETGPPLGGAYRTIAEATQGAVDWSIEHNAEIAVTGHADRDILRAAGIAFVDSRGNKRRGGGARARQREKWDRIMEGRRREAGAVAASTGPLPAGAERRNETGNYSVLPFASTGPLPAGAERSGNISGSGAGAQVEDRERQPKTGELSAAKREALAKARSRRSSARERTAPEGYRSVDHFLDSVREFVGRGSGRTLELARYLGVNESSVRRWIKREKVPLQATLDAMNRWLVSGKGGGM